MDDSKAHVGLYESIITDSRHQDLDGLDSDLVKIQKAGLHAAEAGDRLALHVGKVVESALASVGEKDRVELGVKLLLSTDQKG